MACEWEAFSKRVDAPAALGLPYAREGRIVYPTEMRIEEIGLMMVGEKEAER